MADSPAVFYPIFLPMEAEGESGILERFEKKERENEIVIDKFDKISKIEYKCIFWVYYQFIKIC